MAQSLSVAYLFALVFNETIFEDQVADGSNVRRAINDVRFNEAENSFDFGSESQEDSLMHTSQIELIEKVDALFRCNVCSGFKNEMKIQRIVEIFCNSPAVAQHDDQCTIFHKVPLQSMLHELTFDSFVISLSFTIFSHEKFWFLEMLSVFCMYDFTFWCFA